MLDSPRGVSPNAAGLFNGLRTILASVPNPKVSNDGTRNIIQADLPILESDPSDSQISDGAKYPFLAAALIAKRCEDYLFRSNRSDVVALLHMNAAAETALATDNRLDSKMAELEKLQSDKNLIFTQIDQLRDELRKVLDAAHDSLKRFNKDVGLIGEKEEQARAKREQDWQEEKKLALQALRDEISEYTKIEASIGLWRNKARNHTIAYLALGTAFGSILLGIAISLVLGFIGEFVQRLTIIPSDHQFLGVALLVVPTLAVAWFLRFLGRLAIQNFSLANDASQRHAQIQTYLRLLGDPKKPISEQERILALAALFRPLPGQGADDVSPPTVVDLLKEAQERFTKTN
jgi:hypothetical protein